eukprot:8448527-Pyramimonas_sp.AAC.1
MGSQIYHTGSKGCARLAALPPLMACGAFPVLCCADGANGLVEDRPLLNKQFAAALSTATEEALDQVTDSSSEQWNSAKSDSVCRTPAVLVHPPTTRLQATRACHVRALTSDFDVASVTGIQLSALSGSLQCDGCI